MKSIIPFILLFVINAPAEDKSVPIEGQHFIETHISRQASTRYLLSLPSGYSESKQKWPLLFFLHGGSGRGENLNLVKKYGPPAIAARRSDYPFVVLAPQCPKGEIWTDTDLLISLLDEVIDHYKIDPDRVYLAGASMGGRGVLYLAYKHPDRFAAIVPLCAWAQNNDWAQTLRNLPVWVFHGDNDKEVPLSESEEMVKMLRAAGNSVKFTILPGRGHDIVDIFERADLIEWLLQQRREH